MSSKSTVSQAARDRIDKQLQALTLTGAEIEALKAKLFELTEAKETVRIGRNEAGAILYGEAPNLQIQLGATVRLLEFGIGKPRQQIEVSSAAQSAAPRITRADLVSMLADDPGIAVNLIAVMQAVSGMKQAHPIEEVKTALPAPPPESESGGSHSGGAKT